MDTPKGDLDASGGKLTGPNKRVVYNDFIYPKGTTEQYPETSDLDGLILRNTAHEYRECSNKGICDRSSGTCACFEGYEGSACQRASCPSNGDGVCSGHGTCETIQEIANRDNGNIYRLWDAESTLGCVCDGGFAGPDCSEKICKYGTDPLYYDGPQTVRYSNWTFFLYTRADACLTGNYSLVFTDSFGEDWQTVPIDAHATCDDIQGALESLPNNVVPVDSVRCFKSQATSNVKQANGCLKTSTSGQEAIYIEPIYDTGMKIHSKYTIAFPSNPGKLPQISINKYLDGKRPTLYTDEAVSTLGWKVFANGFTGEDVDYVPDLCEDVLVTLSSSDATISAQFYHYLDGLTAAEAKLLKICLGDSNGNSADNVETYNWDYGKKENPHLIKLVDATQDTSTAVTNALGDITYDFQKQKYPVSRLCAVSQTNKFSDKYPGKFDATGISICEARDPPGFYAVLYFDSNTGLFKLYNRAGQDFITSGTTSSTQFYVFTTKGYLQLVNHYAGVFSTSKYYSSATNINKYYTNVVHQTNTTDHWGDRFHGNMDCETSPIGLHGQLDCINKGDKLMLIDTDPEPPSFRANSVYPNMYTVKKITRERKTFDSDPSRPDDEKVRNTITLDISLNTNFQWVGGTQTRPPYLTDTTASVYKFHPDPTSADGGYLYATECSNRGICNTKTGQCQCFPGFSTDNCAVVNNLVN